MLGLQKTSYISNTTNNINSLSNTQVTETPENKKQFSPNKNFWNQKTIAILILAIISILSIALNIVLIIIYNKKPNCKSGYYLPDDDKSICYKCQLENCETCQGSINSQKCVSCKKNYYEKLNKDGNISDCLKNGPEPTTTIPEPTTTTPEPDTTTPESTSIVDCGEKCEICDNLQKKCQKCIKGYFIPDNEELELNCQKCTLENCEQCEGLKDSNICKKCKANFIPVNDEK